MEGINEQYLSTVKFNRAQSYSMMLEKKSLDDPLSKPLPKIIHKWADDNTAKKCLNCKREFSFLLRKHHCRLCGKIFCAECSKYRKKIPKDLLSNESKNPTWNDYFSYVDYEEKRVCVNCNILINRINQVKKIIDVFYAIEMNILELHKASKKCKLWKFAANYCLSKFKNTQYKLPTHKFNKNEKLLLWTNKDLVCGHSRYILSLLMICESDDEINKVIDIIENKKQLPYISCKEIMCTRNCTKIMTSLDAINLLAHCFNRNGADNCELLKKIALKYLICSDKEFKCYIPLLVHHLKRDVKGLLSNYLISRCTKNFDLLNSLFWELSLYPKEEYHEESYITTLKKLTEHFSNKQHHKTFVNLIKGKAFTDIIQKIGISICDEGKPYYEVRNKFTLNDPVVYPLDPYKNIAKIHLEQIKFKNSMSKPIIIPCETDDKKLTKLMYKKDNLRNDQIIMNLIQLAQIIIKKEENIDLNIMTYNILPLTKNSGLIEIVDDADTIYYIKQKLENTILNYMINKNGNMKIEEFKEIYIKSAAAYSVLTYLFGIGDRHLDNIMITRDARMFHIDFGFILGKDPVFNNPGIRITPDMIEAIGGLSSEYYKKFTELSSKIYNCLRRNVDIFMNMLLLLLKLNNDIDITEEEVCDQIIKRFIPGENEINAHFHLIRKLEEHSYTDRIKDWCHYHSKEGTINSAITRLGCALNTISGFVTSIQGKSDKKKYNHELNE